MLAKSKVKMQKYEKSLYYNKIHNVATKVAFFCDTYQVWLVINLK